MTMGLNLLYLIISLLYSSLFYYTLTGDPDLNSRTSDEFLLQFLRARKYNVHKSFSLLKKYMNFKRKNIHIFTGMDYDRIGTLITNRTIRFLPYRDSDGCVIIAVHLGEIINIFILSLITHSIHVIPR